MALHAQRDQVTLNVLVAKPFICFVMHLKSPLRSIVQARLALVAVYLQSLRALAGPGVTSDMAAVQVVVALHHALLHTVAYRPLIVCLVPS